MDGICDICKEWCAEVAVLESGTKGCFECVRDLILEYEKAEEST